MDKEINKSIIVSYYLSKLLLSDNLCRINQMKLLSVKNPSFHLDISLDDMSPDTLREQLRLAVKKNDRKKLEQLIDIAEEAQYPELAFDLRDARLALNKMGGGFGGNTITHYTLLTNIS